MSIDLDRLQAEFAEWHSRELSPTPGRLTTAAKVSEEAGEYIGAVLKGQELRNDNVDRDAEARKEMGDVLIALCGAAWAQGWQLSEVVEERWRVIRERRYGTRGVSA